MGKRHKKVKAEKKLWVQKIQSKKKRLRIDEESDLTVFVTRVELPNSSWKNDIKTFNNPEPNNTDWIPARGIDNPRGQCDETQMKARKMQVVVSPSAIGPIKYLSSDIKINNYKPLPNGDCGDGIVNPHNKNEVPDKYWAQRFRLLSKFDQGIQLDSEGWYSITPELIAEHIAARVMKTFHPDNGEKLTESKISSDEPSKVVILDLCCGVGGNTIAFAKCPNTLVVAVDNNADRLRLAANNCATYSIPTQSVIFIHCDAYTVLRHLIHGDVKPVLHQNQCEIHMGYTIGGLDQLPSFVHLVHSSPPWAGPSYIQKETFSLQDIQMLRPIKVDESGDQIPDVADSSVNSFTGVDLLNLSLQASRSKIVIIFLPRNLDGEKLGHEALSIDYHGTVELEQNILYGKLKTVTAYFSG